MAGAHGSMKKGGEIAVFDAGRYFAGAENRRLRLKESNAETEDESEEDDDTKLADADGDLPLSPLPEFYNNGRARQDTKRDQQIKQGNVEAPHRAYAQGAIAAATRAAPAPRQTAIINRNVKPTGGSIPISSPATQFVDSLPRHNNSKNPPPQIAADSSAPGKSNSSSTKPQPFSPSMRLASFLAKFKISTESKSKQHSSSTTSPGAVAQQPVTPPKSFFSNSSSLPPNGKLPSPRSRFLRALSSSSSQSSSLLKPKSDIRHHGSMAASTPVSPAGSDPYSPTTHSASTTPYNLRKNPRSRPRSHVPTSPASLDWRRDIDNPSSRSTSLSAHLPFIRRKLRAYLMPDKSPRQGQNQENGNKTDRLQALNHDGLHHQVISKSQDNKLHLGNSNRIGVNKQQLAATSAAAGVALVADKTQAATSAKNTQAAELRSLAATAGLMQQDQNSRKQYKGNSNMPSPAQRSAMGTAMAADAVRRGRGEYWGQRKKGEREEDDIEVAERLLRVVKEHQSAMSRSTHHQTTYNYAAVAGAGGNGYNSKARVMSSSAEMNANGGAGAHATRKSRKSTMSPFSSPARNGSSAKHPLAQSSAAAAGMNKDEFTNAACPYDSDSSSDLFEIETLQAFSHVAGLYRPRDLPIFTNDSTKFSPLHPTTTSSK